MPLHSASDFTNLLATWPHADESACFHTEPNHPNSQVPFKKIKEKKLVPFRSWHFKFSTCPASATGKISDKT